MPATWTLHNETQKVSRYRTRAVVDAMSELEIARENLLLAAKSAWMSFLGVVSDKYAEVRHSSPLLFTCHANHLTRI